MLETAEAVLFIFVLQRAHDLSRGLPMQKKTKTISMVLSHHVTLRYALTLEKHGLMERTMQNSGIGKNLEDV